MAAESPIHSFVDFENRLSNAVLPAYRAQLAFQFMFSSDLDIPRTGDVQVYAGNAERNATLFLLAASYIDVCFWGKITGIDADADFPITISAHQIIPEGEYATLDDLYTALQAVGFNSDSDTFLQCCSENLQDYTIEGTKQDDSPLTITITFYRGLVYVAIDVNQEADFETNGVTVSKCYSIAVKHELQEAPYYSNLFQRVANTAYLTFISYFNNEDAYDFHYPAGYLVNKLWLPFYLNKPIYPEERKIYRKSNKTYKVQFATIEKLWEAITDWLPDNLHDRMIVALAHDNIHFYSTSYQKQFAIDQDVFKKDDYSIDWQDGYIPGSDITAPSKFHVLQVFAGRNSNCEKRPSCMALPIPFACQTVEIISSDLDAGVVGQSYTGQIQVTGTSPITVNVNTLPSWMTASVLSDVVIDDITYSFILLHGTPTDAGDDLLIDIDLINCGDGVTNFTGSINVSEGEEGGTDAHWTNTLSTEGDATYYQETIQIQGEPGAVIGITVENYINPYPGTIEFNGSGVTAIGNTFSQTLDGSGLSPVITLRLFHGPYPGHSYGMLCKWTITSTSIGSIGVPASRQISKAFTS